MTIENSQTFDWLGDTSAPVAYHFYDNSVTLYYDDDAHSYTRYDAEGNLVYITNVTTAVHIVDKSEALTQWSANQTVQYLQEKIAAHRAEGKSWADITEEMFTVWMNEARFNFRNTKDRAAETGKIAHGWIEDFIRALMRNDLEGVVRLVANLPEDERARNGCLAALNFMARHKVRWIYTERKIYSREHDYAGTCDGLAYTTSCGDPECCGRYDMETGLKAAIHFTDALAVVDWKTSNRLYTEYGYQTAAYDKSMQEELGIFAEYRFITRLGKEDAKFESRLLFADTLEQDFDIFLKCLALYNAIQAQEDSQRALKAAVKAVLKQRREEADAARRAERAAYHAEVAARREAEALAIAQRKAEREQKKQEKEAQDALYKELRKQGHTVASAKALVYGASA